MVYYYWTLAKVKNVKSITVDAFSTVLNLPGLRIILFTSLGVIRSVDSLFVSERTAKIHTKHIILNIVFFHLNNKYL